MKKMIASIAMAAVAAVLGGCAGYRWTSDVPESMRTVAVPTFSGATPRSNAYFVPCPPRTNVPSAGSVPCRYTHASTVNLREKTSRSDANAACMPLVLTICAERDFSGLRPCTGEDAARSRPASIWISIESGSPSLSVSRPGIGISRGMLS